MRSVSTRVQMDCRACGWSAFDVLAGSFEAAATECRGSAEEAEGHLQAPTLPTVFTHDLKSLSVGGGRPVSGLSRTARLLIFDPSFL